MLSSFSRLVTLTVAASALLALVGVSGSAAAQADLSRSERSRLRRGELVVRPERQRHGGVVTFGGTSYQVVDAPLGEAWQAMRRTSNYTEMLPQVDSARVVTRRGQERYVQLRHVHGPIDVRYTMVFTFDDTSHTILFRLDDGRHHDIRAGWGFIRLSTFRGDKTLVSFGAMVGIDSGMIGGAMRPQLHEWILKVPLTMKWFFDRARS